MIAIDMLALIIFYTPQTFGQTGNVPVYDLGEKQELMAQIRLVLEDPSASVNLELTDEQKKKLDEMVTQYNQVLRETVLPIQKVIRDTMDDPSLSQEERKRAVDRLVAEQSVLIRGAVEPRLVEMNEILLPFQVMRLKQLTMQRLMSLMGGRGYESVLNVADRLGLTPEEAKKFEEDVREIQKRYEKELAEIRERYGKEVVAALPPEAQKKLEELIGPFYFSSRDR
jgi:hypothetical protein